MNHLQTYERAGDTKELYGTYDQKRSECRKKWARIPMVQECYKDLFAEIESIFCEDDITGLARNARNVEYDIIYNIFQRNKKDVMYFLRELAEDKDMTLLQFLGTNEFADDEIIDEKDFNNICAEVGIREVAREIWLM